MVVFLLFLACAFIAGGINFTFVKLGVQEFSPLVFIFSRFLLASIILFFPWLRRREMMSVKDLVKISPFTLNVILFSFGLANTTILAGGTITLIIPILVGILSYYLLNEKLKKNHIIGLIFALVGVSFILVESFGKQNSQAFGSVLGNLTLVISSTSFAFYTVGVRKLSDKYLPTTILFFTFLTACLFSGILVPIELVNHSFKMESITSIGFTSVIILSIAAVLLYFMYQWIIKHASAFAASLMLYGQFIFTNLAGTILFNEKLSVKFVFGSALILLGVFVATTYGYIKR